MVLILHFLSTRYCSKFPSSGVGAIVPVCRTKEVWTDSQVEFVSTLYLPRNSPVYWPIKVPNNNNNNNNNDDDDDDADNDQSNTSGNL